MEIICKNILFLYSRDPIQQHLPITSQKMKIYLAEQSQGTSQLPNTLSERFGL